MGTICHLEPGRMSEGLCISSLGAVRVSEHVGRHSAQPMLGVPTEPPCQLREPYMNLCG